MNGLYAIKPWYTRRLRRLVDLAVARRISPDVFTQGGSLGLVGVVAAGAAAVCGAQGWWLGALAALAAWLAGANLNGAVARALGVSRPWGFVLNELGDRASDLIVFGGLAAMTPQSAASVRGLSCHTAPASISDAALAGVRPVNPTRAPGGDQIPGHRQPRRSEPDEAQLAVHVRSNHDVQHRESCSTL